MDEAWFSKIESRIYTIFKKRMRDNFPTISFTTEQEKVVESKFPMVYLHELEQLEQGNDLENITVNAVLSTIQIQVFTKTAAENKRIMTEAVLQMKRLAFNVVAMPIYDSKDDKTLHFSVARFRRMIGSGDSNITAQGN